MCVWYRGVGVDAHHIILDVSIRYNKEQYAERKRRREEKGDAR